MVTDRSSAMTPASGSCRRADSSARASLDACLIVRDEENNLPGCIRSLLALRPLLGQVLIYDTGSTDATVRIARGLGCRVEQGYWDDDFSRARNASLAMSRASWALIIDADERVVADADVLGRVLDGADGIDVFNASFSHFDSTGRVIGRSIYEKVVRVGAVDYAGRIHETVRRRDGGQVCSRELQDDELHFHHFGYSTAEIRRAKAERNAAIAQADVEAATEAGDPLSIGLAQYHLARSLQRLGRMPEVLSALSAARSVLPVGSLAAERVVKAQVETLLEAGRAAEAGVIAQGFIQQGGSPQLARLLVAQVAARTAAPEKVLGILRQLPEAGDLSHDVDPREVLRLRMSAYDQLHRFDEALACCLLLVTRWNDLLYLPDLLNRVRGQEASAVAALLGSRGAEIGLLREALRLQGDFGHRIAEWLP
ncbi:glycosyltransferase [Mobilicoccus sp.]|uniref:glycosyltransferase n=1 Tax=Mobilicoccus sp. TaxID=2034349 RepID=UPI0028B065D2|nr:glycosyltransferase [Mobilicoccus sp.]